jgi:endonuclease/exonuclease/phosphatase (EEP) superfamily protein YafD
MSALSRVRWAAWLALIPLLAGCITLTADPRAVVSERRGSARVMTLGCDAAVRMVRNGGAGNAADALDRSPFRLLDWNVHKQADPGWERDLSEFAAPSDVVLLQEAVLQPPLLRILDDAGLRWVMASSFLLGDEEFGVLTATHIAPIASCTQRATEPLIRIPKSAVISWLPIANTSGGTRETLAIVNVHSINFELVLDGFRAQVEGLADVLAGHRGPIIFGGDFNTWNDARDAVLRETTARLGLTEVQLRVDRRALFFGRHLDHLFVRGLEVVEIDAIAVSSSDHNPIAATFRIP